MVIWLVQVMAITPATIWDAFGLEHHSSVSRAVSLMKDMSLRRRVEAIERCIR